jgi:hypothetical protein
MYVIAVIEGIVISGLIVVSRTTVLAVEVG